MDIRKTLADNIYLVGGTSMIQGFKETFRRNMLAQIAQDTLMSHLHGNLIESSFKANVAAWVGASVFGALKGVSSHSQIHRADWIAQTQE